MNFIFLLTAPFMTTLDEKCFAKYSYAIEILFYTIGLKKMIFLMNKVNMQPIVASTLFDMFQRRKSAI